MISDMEVVVGAYLRGHPGVEPTRVVTKHPKDRTDGWVAVHQLDAIGDRVADHLIDYLIQIDCYAGAANSRDEASDLAGAVREAVGDMSGGTHSDTVIGGVRFTGHTPDPDEDFEPARERYVLLAEIVAHRA